MEIEETKENLQNADQHVINSKMPIKRFEIKGNEDVRKEAMDLLKQKSLKEVFYDFNEKIPKQTLGDGKKRHSPELKKGQGMKPKFPEIEASLFEWFLVARARKIEVRDVTLKIQARKIANQLNISEEKFHISKGGITNFKKRYHITLRKTTTNAKKLISTISILVQEGDGDDSSSSESDFKSDLYSISDSIGIYFVFFLFS